MWVTPVAGAKTDEWEEWTKLFEDLFLLSESKHGSEILTFGRDEIFPSLLIVEDLSAGDEISVSLESERHAFGSATILTLEFSDSEDESFDEWLELVEETDEEDDLHISCNSFIMVILSFDNGRFFLWKGKWN
jgi:hypothetical protein